MRTVASFCRMNALGIVRERWEERAVKTCTAVPRGTILGMQNYAIHRSEWAFLDPQVFRLER